MVERLIDNFVPEHYEIFWDLNRENKNFQGNVKITGEVLKETFKLHQKDLEITKVLADGEDVEFEIDNDQDSLIIKSADLGSVVLDIDFNGNITDNMDGIYPSYYTVDSQKKELLSTQFESHFARQAFPSVDEPEAKATFSVSIKFDEEPGEVALSNMPEIDSESRKTTGVWKFDTTPRMSTYLLAFVVGDLQGKTTTTKNGTLIGAYSTKSHELSSLDFALETAKNAIEFFEEYYGIDYPLAQSLHVGLPDFSAGAMENWGLVTYREQYIVNDDNSSQRDLTYSSVVISHELAHQWFGNLVTMKWWDNLWLNESFADLMESIATDNLYPDFKVWEDNLAYSYPAALNKDATDGVQSVQTEVNHPDEINSLFDPQIVYTKGGRLLQMLYSWLSEEDFRAGLKLYFDKHQYANTEGDDLWDALSEASGKDVSSFMNPWIKQAGYPIVTVSLEDDAVKFDQRQFFIGEHGESSTLWPIPLNSNWDGLDNNLEERSLVLDGYASLRESNGAPLLLNQENKVHYITYYTGQLWQDILDNFDMLDDVTQSQIIVERTLLAKSHDISNAELVALANKLRDSSTYLTATSLSRVDSSLSVFIDENSEEEKTYKIFIDNIFSKLYETYGLTARDSDVAKEEQIRSLVNSYMLYANNDSLIADAHEVYLANEDNLAAIPVSIRSLVLGNEMENFETVELADKFINLYTNSNNAGFKRELSAALARTKNVDTLEKILSKWKDKDFVKPQDLASWYARFLGKKFSEQTTWDWSRNNWDWITKTLGGDMSSDAFITIPSRVFSTQERLDEYKEFFKDEFDNPAYSRNLNMGVKQIAARIELINHDKDNVLAAIDALVK